MYVTNGCQKKQKKQNKINNLIKERVRNTFGVSVSYWEYNEVKY